MNNHKPLLSIVVPTWNRAETLRQSLAILFDQIHNLSEQDKELVEFIISDNHADDHTQQVIEGHIADYPTVKVHYNRNKENILFYGNVKKSRELATGKYLWLLSDDEFLEKGIIKRIVDTLSPKNYAFLHLTTGNYDKNYTVKDVSFNGLISIVLSKITLISTMIFLNDKSNDEFIYSHFHKHEFIGCILFIDLATRHEQGAILQGMCFKSVANETSKGYNYFHVFTTKINEIFRYYVSSSKVGEGIKLLKKKWIKHHIFIEYLLFRLNIGKAETLYVSNRSEVEALIHDNFKSEILYWIILFPVTLLPTSLLLHLKNIYFSLKKSSIYKPT